MLKSLCIGATALILSLGAAWAQNATDTRGMTVQQATVMHAGKQVGNLHVVAWVNRKDRTYARGEVVRLFVANKSNRNVYVTAFDVGPANPPHIVRLFPNKFQKSQLVKAHRTIEIAGHKNKAEIVVSHSEPVGAEVIKIVASTKPEPVVPVSGLTAAGPFFLVKGSIPEFARQMEIVSHPGHAPDEQVAIIGLKVKTIEKR